MSAIPTARAARGPRRALAWLDAWLARQGSGRVFGGCLAALAAAVVVCYVVPLTPGFVAMHQVPTNADHHAFGKEQGLVSVFWLVSTLAFTLALVGWRRGLRPGMRLLVGGAVTLNALALLVPPVGSEDVYTYSYYGVVQHTFGESPYVAIPESHPRHPWYPFWAWRDTSAVYGPPFLLLLRAVAAVVGGSMLAWVIVMKLLLVAFLAAGVWLLVRATATDGPGAGAGGWPLVLVAWNPMVLQAVAMSAHVDAIMLAGVAGAVLAHRRGRFAVAFVLLTLTFLIKLYIGPLVALYGLWLAWRVPAAAGRPRVTLLRRGGALCGLGLAAAAGTMLAYLPFTGPGVDTLFGSVLDVGQGFSSGSPPNIVRRLLAVVGPWLGLSQTAAFGVGMTVARVLSAAAILGLLGWCAWRMRPGRDPWPLLAAWLTGYLLLTPWVFYWHLVPLLGIAAAIPWGATALVATVMSLNLVPMAAAGRGLATGGMPPPAVELGQTVVGHLSRYAATDVTLWLVWRGRRRTGHAGAADAGERSASRPPASSGTVTSTR